MSDKRFLIDSNIIIYHLNGELVATEFLAQNINHCAVSRLSFIEILSFDFTPTEKVMVENLLERFAILDTSGSIAKQALQNRANKKIKIADNIIAATAQVHGLTLVTRNIRDFQTLSVGLLNPFEKQEQ